LSPPSIARRRRRSRSSRLRLAAGRPRCCAPGPTVWTGRTGSPSCRCAATSTTPRILAGPARRGPSCLRHSQRHRTTGRDTRLQRAAMVDRVLAELADRRGRLILVIDDLHELTVPDALAQLTWLLTNLPPACTRCWPRAATCGWACISCAWPASSLRSARRICVSPCRRPASFSPPRISHCRGRDGAAAPADGRMGRGLRLA